MLDVNIVNFITVGLMAVIAVVLVRIMAKAINKPSPV